MLPNYGLPDKLSPGTTPVKVEEVEMTNDDNTNSNTYESKDFPNLETFGPLRSVSQSEVKIETHSAEEEHEENSDFGEHTLIKQNIDDATAPQSDFGDQKGKESDKKDNENSFVDNDLDLGSEPEFFDLLLQNQ